VLLHSVASVRRTVLISALLVALVAGLAVGALAFADDKGSERIAEGVRVSGVDVGGLTRGEALAKLRDRIGTPVRQAARVRVGERTFTLSAERARVRVALGAAVNRAYELSREGGFIERGWRELTGGTIDRDETAPIAIDRRAVRSFVGSVHAAVARKPVDAKLDIQLTSVGVSESRTGRRLAGREDLVQRIAAAMTNPRADRSLRARTAVVKPKVSTDEVWEATPTVITVAREGKTVRVFKRGEVAQSYRVAVGEPKYPTPTGQFSVQTKQVDPPWNVPNSDWAGDLAGQTIPGGDPRNPLVARWIGFNGAVGFHGTKSIDSLGRSASHGCVRMAPGDVIDLYERVQVGTPVLVA
jgi:lipoprotein-anchoring transpeptidase ErfK/SrfK